MGKERGLFTALLTVVAVLGVGCVPEREHKPPIMTVVSDQEIAVKSAVKSKLNSPREALDMLEKGCVVNGIQGDGLGFILNVVNSADCLNSN